jgi:hypothetical protein
MLARLVSVWIAVFTSAIISFFCYVTTSWLQGLHWHCVGNKPMPVITEWFYHQNGGYIYYYPLVLIAWAFFYTIKYRQSTEHAALLRTVCFSLILVFWAVYVFAMIIPVCPMPTYQLEAT